VVTRLAELKPLLQIPLEFGAYLRPIKSSDITNGYIDGLNDPSVNRFMGRSRERRQTLETVSVYVEENGRNPNDVLFGIFIEGAVRGTVRLHDIKQGDQTAIVGVLIFDKNYWQKGWASRSISAVIGFARRELGITTFKAGMVAENTASRNTFASLGFRHRIELDQIDSQNVAIEYWQLDIT
jgi:[ribosomal protein S5]-alanine N-acetyltransferase